MCHECWTFNKTFHTSKTLGQDKELKRREELVCLVDVSVDVDAHHTAATVQVFRGSVLLSIMVVRMRLETWVDNLLYFWMLFQVFGDDQSIVSSFLGSNLEGLRASKSKICAEGRHDVTETLLVEPYLLIHFRVIEHKTSTSDI